MGTNDVDLSALVSRVRNLPGVAGKSAIGAVSDVLGATDWFEGPGDDGAVLPEGSGQVVVGAEAILPDFVAADPREAGVSAVLTNVNDLAAMGARPVAILDTVVGSDEVNRAMLEGLHFAARLYDVPIVGGHLTRYDGAPALSACGLGRANTVLSARDAAPGQSLILGCCLDGRMRPDFPFFSALETRAEKMADDVRLIAEIADRGLAEAAKDVSMAGLVGSLAMLLEVHGLGVDLDLDRIPVPAGVELADWLGCFPSYAFLVTTSPENEAACLAAFESRDLTAARIGVLDNSGEIRLRAGEETATVFDLGSESVTYLRR